MTAEFFSIKCIALAYLKYNLNACTEVYQTDPCEPLPPTSSPRIYHQTSHALTAISGALRLFLPPLAGGYNSCTEYSVC